MISWLEGMDGVGPELAGVGQAEPEQGAGVQFRGRGGMVQLLADAGEEGNVYHYES